VKNLVSLLLLLLVVGCAFMVGKEIATAGRWFPDTTPSNTQALCGTGKLSEAVEDEVCEPEADPKADPEDANKCSLEVLNRICSRAVVPSVCIKKWANSKECK